MVARSRTIYPLRVCSKSYVNPCLQSVRAARTLPISFFMFTVGLSNWSPGRAKGFFAMASRGLLRTTSARLLNMRLKSHHRRLRRQRLSSLRELRRLVCWLPSAHIVRALADELQIKRTMDGPAIDPCGKQPSGQPPAS